MRPVLLAVPVAALLSACAGLGNKQSAPASAPAPVAAPTLSPAAQAKLTAAQDTLIQMASLQDRLFRVGAPLLINNAELCKAMARNLLGFSAKNKYSYGGDMSEAAHGAFDLDERLQVTNVLAGSGAARAGLRRGDSLFAAEGKTLPTGPGAESHAGAVFGPLVASHAVIKLNIERGSESTHISVPVTRACGFKIDLGNADNINSYADGQRVLVTRGMLGVTQSDAELAYVLARGMAHNILGHAGSQRASGTIGSVIDNLSSVHPDLSMLIGSAGIKPMPAELDAQADTLALYLLARASADYEHAGRFWRALTDKYPATVLNGYVANHPATTVRLAAIDKAVAEIKSKQASKKPLVP